MQIVEEFAKQLGLRLYKDDATAEQPASLQSEKNQWHDVLQCTITERTGYLFPESNRRAAMKVLSPAVLALAMAYCKTAGAVIGPVLKRRTCSVALRRWFG